MPSGSTVHLPAFWRVFFVSHFKEVENPVAACGAAMLLNIPGFLSAISAAAKFPSTNAIQNRPDAARCVSVFRSGGTG